MVEWRDWGAFCADTLDTKPMIVGANCITLDELVNEVMPLLSHYAPIITEDQIPQFMAWDANDLTGSLAYLKSSYLSKPWS
jgi:hypothetical protein